jgi:hypothetical protein
LFPFPRRYLLKARKDEAITGLCMQPGFFMSKTGAKLQKALDKIKYMM